jgi:hypothetical protein
MSSCCICTSWHLLVPPSTLWICKKCFSRLF